MKVVTVNRRAFHDYEILEKFEAGIVLFGSEVKSLRQGWANLKESYIVVKNREAFLLNAHISPYPCASYLNHEPKRERKLLLHQRELRRLEQKIKTKGIAIVPLKIYFNHQGIAKLEIAMVRGKKEFEKKQKIKEKDIQREIERDLKYYR